MVEKYLSYTIFNAFPSTGAKNAKFQAKIVNGYACIIIGFLVKYSYKRNCAQKRKEYAVSRVPSTALKRRKIMKINVSALNPELNECVKDCAGMLGFDLCADGHALKTETAEGLTVRFDG